jgi:hypothetical protein
MSNNIYYTTDGSTPACPATGTLYSGAISVATSETLKAIACKASYNSSSVLSAAYVINTTPPITPPVFPLKVSTDGRHLVDQNDVPFIIVGESAWTLLTEVSAADTDIYLDDRQAKGFNTIMVMLTVHGYPGFPNAPATASGIQPFTTPGNFSTPNSAYFAYVDSVINKAAARGMLVLLAPAYLGYHCGTDVQPEGWCAEMKTNGTTIMQNYGAYIGSRYASFPNIIWLNGGDCNAASYGATAVMEAVITGMKAYDSNHLHTAHCSRYSSAYDCDNNSWLDVNTAYSDCTSTASAVSTDYNQSTKPLFFIEGYYENDDNAPSQQCLDSHSYWSVTGGAFGALFGNDPIIYFGSGWQSSLDLQGSTNQSNFGTFFRSISWHTLVPDYAHTVMTAGYGTLTNTTYAGCARASDGLSIVAYLPTQRAVTIDMTKVSGTPVTAKWFNPTTAVYTTIGTYANTGTQSFTPPSSGDWALLLTAQSSPAPRRRVIMMGN